MYSPSEDSPAAAPGAAITPPPSRSKQKPACEECRRRKLRCDGKKPQCSTCENAGTECDINTDRVPRGPKKGYLRALQNKIATLEDRLQAQGQAQLKWTDTNALESWDAMLPGTTALLQTTTADPRKLRTEPNFVGIPNLCSPSSEADMFLSPFCELNPMTATTMAMMAENTPTSSSAGSSAGSTNTTSLIQSELDQIYFDRIHAAVPILHQRRYLSRSKSAIKTRSRECLQCAVWVTASLTSPQFQYLQDMLYPDLKRMLASASLPTHPSGQQPAVDVELAQAWVLTATYEFVKSYHREACISAGHAFRLVQLMRLYEVDHASNDSPSAGAGGADFVNTEEKRRVFWMAFVLEALYSMRNNLPLVVNEHTISTLLPVPDHEFQNGRWMQTQTLSDCMTQRSQMVKSPLNECILLITMCAQTPARAQLGYKQHRRLYNLAEGDWVEWQQFLDDVLSLRLQTLAQDYPCLSDSSDPMLLFANFWAHATVIYLCREFQKTNGLEEGGGGRGSRQALVAAYQQRAYAAVERTIELARSLSDFPFSKIHPFTPIPLFLSIEFLSYNNTNSSSTALLQNLLDAIRQFLSTNNAQQSYIELLGPFH